MATALQVLACMSDCECSTRTSFTHMSNLYSDFYSYLFQCEWSLTDNQRKCQLDNTRYHGFEI